MKVLILSIFSETEYYNKMRDVQRKYVNSTDVFHYFFITFKQDIDAELILEGDTLYIRGIESNMTILEKTIIALEFFKKRNQYDFFIRTNVSTIINYKTLTLYLESARKTKLFAGGFPIKIFQRDNDPSVGISLFKKHIYSMNDIYFFQGTCIIMSIDVADFMVKNANGLKYDIIDDVAIGLFIKTYLPEEYSMMANTPLPRMSINTYNPDCVIIRNRSEPDRMVDVNFMEKTVGIIYGH